MVITAVVVPMVMTTAITTLPMPDVSPGCGNQVGHRVNALVTELNQLWH